MSSSSRNNLRRKKNKPKAKKAGSSAGSKQSDNVKPKSRVYVPNSAVSIAELEMDKSAYRVYHAVETHEACLSFDIIADSLGESRETAPFTLYLVSGTQAEVAASNALYVIRMSNMRGVRQRKSSENSDSDSDSDSDSSSSESDSDGEVQEKNGSNRGKGKAQIDLVEIAQPDCVNRVRVTQWNDKPICASWSEQGRVMVYDLSEQMAALDDMNARAEYLRSKRRDHIRPLFTFSGHRSTGFALDFSRVERGRLATGDSLKNIHIWHPRTDGTWHVSNAPFEHTSSVEDLAWSPRERDVLASASSDHSIRVWDVRLSAREACVATVANAHESDVNVISWNRKETQFLVSGGDDAALRIWDLRLVKGNCDVDEAALATFKHHLAPITSVEWAYHDSGVFAASGEDDQVTQWDLAVEADAPKAEDSDDDEDEAEAEASNSKAAGEDEQEGGDEKDEPKKKKAKTNKKKKKQEEDEDLDKLPEQLLFIHQGQQEVKELHWHEQIPGLLVSTSLTGFNVFRTISV